MISILGTVGTLSVIILLFVLARLSERFGSVVKMRPLYRYYFVSLFLVLVSATTHILAASADSMATDNPSWLTNPWFLLLAFHLPLTVAVSIALYVTWRYWGWLITERND
jgi:hypothetical protein